MVEALLAQRREQTALTNLHGVLEAGLLREVGLIALNERNAVWVDVTEADPACAEQQGCETKYAIARPQISSTDSPGRIFM